MRIFPFREKSQLRCAASATSSSMLIGHIPQSCVAVSQVFVNLPCFLLKPIAGLGQPTYIQKGC